VLMRRDVNQFSALGRELHRATRGRSDPVGLNAECPGGLAELDVNQGCTLRTVYIYHNDICRLGYFTAIICTVKIEDQVLVDLHRAASLADRPGIAVPSRDLKEETGKGRQHDVKGALNRLTRSGRILSVRKDLVVLPDATGRVAVGLPELIGVVAPAHHLITGGRALEMSDLTDQYSFSVVVLVPTPVQEFSFRGEKAVFYTTKPARIWGWRSGNLHFALPERAILDAVNHPRYGVSLQMAQSALRSAVDKDPEFLGLLSEAARRYDSTAAARRIGLLIDRLYGHDVAEPFRMLIGKSRTPVPLRPGGERKGPIDHTWRLIMNARVEPEGAIA
jgi:predicted transcriptional regulator of viral defense system